MQIDDFLYLGAAPTLITDPSGNPGGKGVGPMGRVFMWDLVPLALGLANVAALQTTPGAANLVLAAGAGVTQVTRPDGTIGYQLDTPRCISLTSTGVLTGVNVTINGWDVYGQPMSQTRAGPNNNTVTTLKAFAGVTGISVNGAVGTNMSVGTSDIFGFPFRVTDAGYISSVKWNNTLADNAGTFVAADVTSPATAATGDVRGTFAPTSASDGVKRLVAAILMPAIACGPNATRIGALGVPQV